MLAIIMGSLDSGWRQTDLIVSQDYTVCQLKSLYSIEKKIPYYQVRLSLHPRDFDYLEDDQKLLKDCGIIFGNDVLYRSLVIGCPNSNICFVFQDKKESAILGGVLCNGMHHEYLSKQVKQLHKGSVGYRLFYKDKCVLIEKFKR